MAFLSMPNGREKGVSACVPHTIDDNRVNPLIPDSERDELLSTIGVERKPIVETGVTSSDLCLAAAERLIDELKWRKEDIEGLIFVSQTPDYILPATSCILEYVDRGDGKVQNNLHSNLDGMSVFSFAISQAPKSIKKLCECYGINMDCFVFHQANCFLNEKVRKKLKLPAEKVPYSLKEYGNSSCATIPVTLVTQWRERLQSSRQRIIGCGFGVGLSWSSVYFETEKSIVVPELIVL